MISRRNPKVLHVGTAARQNRSLNLLRNRQFILNRKQPPLSRQSNLHRHIPKRKKQSPQPQRPHNPPSLVMKKERQVVMERLQRKNKRPKNHDPPVRKHQIFPRQSRHRNNHNQHKQNRRPQQLVVNHHFLARASHHKKSQAHHPNRQTQCNHHLQQHAHLSRAQFQPRSRSNRQKEVRNRRTHKRNPALHPRRQSRHHAGRIRQPSHPKNPAHIPNHANNRTRPCLRTAANKHPATPKNKKIVPDMTSTSSEPSIITPCLCNHTTATPTRHCREHTRSLCSSPLFRV